MLQAGGEPGGHPAQPLHRVRRVHRLVQQPADDSQAFEIRTLIIARIALLEMHRSDLGGCGQKREVSHEECW